MKLQVVTFPDRKAVYALLGRMLDWLPPTRLSVGRDESSKPGVGSWRPCTVCGATSRLLGGKPCRQAHVKWPFGHGCTPCPVCVAGHVEVGARAVGSDRMLDAGKHELDTEAQRKAEGRRWVDAQLVKLESLARQRGDAKDPVTGLPLAAEAPGDDLTRAIAAKAHLYRAGSFVALEYALQLLAIESPLRHNSVRMYLIEGVAPVPQTGGTKARLDETVDWLAARMPRPILLPADAVNELEEWKRALQHGKTPEHRRARDQRDRELAELVREHGWSLRRAGDAYALSHTAVRLILDRVQAASVASAPVAA